MGKDNSRDPIAKSVFPGIFGCCSIHSLQRAIHEARIETNSNFKFCSDLLSRRAFRPQRIRQSSKGQTLNLQRASQRQSAHGLWSFGISLPVKLQGSGPHGHWSTLLYAPSRRNHGNIATTPYHNLQDPLDVRLHLDPSVWREMINIRR